ncbi:MAG: insulinase family protein [Clostridia bacterium]|nr:insulinase family protein [Clostridia bacterium]
MEMQRVITAKSGIKIYSYKSPDIHSCHISLYVKAGCLYERPEENGITHFLEHVLYRNVNILMDGGLYATLDRESIELNAATYNEMMQFGASGEYRGFRTMAQIIARLFSPISLSREEFSAELARIKAEIRESDDRTSLAAFSAGIVYEGTPLSRTILGTLGGISAITRRRLEEYRQSVFTPENAFIYVSGRFGEDELEYLKKLLDEVTLGCGKPHENIAEVPEKFFRRDSRAHIKNADFTMVRFSFDMDMSRLSTGVDDLLYDILLGGNNSRFYIELSEKRGVFYDVSGSVEKYKNIGTFAFTYEVRRGSLYEAVRLTLAILSDMKRRIMAEDECMKHGYVSGGELLLDDPRELGYTFAYDTQMMGCEYKSIPERQAVYAAITPERIRDAARVIFKPENMVLAIKGNKRKIDEKIIEAIIDDFANDKLKLD